MSDRVKVLVVGQTPPPYHGQAIMIERLLQGRFARVQLFHVRMAFSESGGEVGRFRFFKLLHLVSIVWQIVVQRIVHRPTILYYPPAGANRLPLFRDLVILGCTRWMFRRVVFHLHATGISELYPRLSWLTRWWFRRALLKPDSLVRIARCGDADARLLQPRREYVVPNGIEDESSRFVNSHIGQVAHPGDLCETSKNGHSRWSSAVRSVEFRDAKDGLSIAADSTATRSATTICESRPLRILFVGMLRESKGVLTLLDACGRLAQRGLPFELEIAGEFQSLEFANQVQARALQHGIAMSVNFLGVVGGDAKWQAYARADVFCFPSFYEAETFPLVVLEAMSSGLPVVATRWRGIPEIVDDGITGYLVEIHAPQAVADCLEQLQVDPSLREELGRAGREKFSREFTVDRFWQRMEKVLIETARV